MQQRSVLLVNLVTIVLALVVPALLVGVAATQGGDAAMPYDIAATVFIVVGSSIKVGFDEFGPRIAAGR